MRTDIVHLANVHVTVEVVDDVVPVSWRHLLGARRERVHDRPDTLESLAVRHPHPRR